MRFECKWRPLNPLNIYGEFELRRGGVSNRRTLIIVCDISTFGGLAEKFVKYSDQGDTATAVNFPEVSIPFKEGSHRLLHIHKNVPGVLSQINRLFAEAGINILAQSLMTEGDVGYLVMDVDYNDSTAALDQLKDVEETIRVRILF